jgi:hypothetical protein
MIYLWLAGHEEAASDALPVRRSVHSIGGGT